MISKMIIVAVWLIIGYFFARWFVNSFLDDRKWADTDEEVGPFTLVVLTLVGPAMGVFMLGTLVVGFILDNYSTTIKRFYGVK